MIVSVTNYTYITTIIISIGTSEVLKHICVIVLILDHSTGEYIPNICEVENDTRILDNTHKFGGKGE